MSKLLRFLGWTCGVLLVLGIAARILFLKAWTIPDDPVQGAAMAPTLHPGDVVLVLTRGTPGFGDLVRCPDPEDASNYIVGRIAGLGGDAVDTQGRSLTVNRTRYDSESACPESTFTVPHPRSGSPILMNCGVVNMGGGWHYRGYNPKATVASKTHTDVGNGMLFLLSDDRDFHDDSRDYGTVSAAACTERIFFRLWSKAGWSDDKARLSYIR